MTHDAKCVRMITVYGKAAYIYFDFNTLVCAYVRIAYADAFWGPINNTETILCVHMKLLLFTFIYNHP